MIVLFAQNLPSKSALDFRSKHVKINVILQWTKNLYPLQDYSM